MAGLGLNGGQLLCPYRTLHMFLYSLECRNKADITVYLGHFGTFLFVIRLSVYRLYVACKIFQASDWLMLENLVLLGRSSRGKRNKFACGSRENKAFVGLGSCDNIQT